MQLQSENYKDSSITINVKHPVELNPDIRSRRNQNVWVAVIQDLL